MNKTNKDFIPKFCPNPECRFHHKHSLDKQWFVRYSGYFCKAENRRCQRFMCLGCKKTFSKRTFASNYCLKLDLKYDKLFARLKQGIRIEEWAEALGHSVSVIENRLKRLGRWLVCQGYLSGHKLLRLRSWGLVRLGLFFMRLWIKAMHPEHQDMRRRFLKQLTRINIVDAAQAWTLLSWSYRLRGNQFYRPTFTYH